VDHPSSVQIDRHSRRVMKVDNSEIHKWTIILLLGIESRAVLERFFAKAGPGIGGNGHG
jgi:hypothetical protein